MPPLDSLLNLLGTSANSFLLGKGGPLLSRVSSTARLLLPNLLRWEQNGTPQAGDLASDGSGDLRVIKHNLSAVTQPTTSNDSTEGYEIGSRWFDVTNQAIYTCIDASVGAAMWLTISPSIPVYGSNYNYAESIALSTTTSATFQNKLTLSVLNLPIGSYRLGWSYGWGSGSGSVSFRGRVEDNATTIMEHHQEVKETASNEIHRSGGFMRLVYGSMANHTYTIDYCSETAGAQARIQEARLELWRVA